MLHEFKITNKTISYLLLLSFGRVVSGQDLISDSIIVIAPKYTEEFKRRQEARKDIRNGLIYLFKSGWFGADKKIDSLSINKYGCKIQAEGCTPVKGREFYNDEVMKYLNKRNGKGWWKQFLKDVSKLNLKEPPPLPIKDD